VVLETPASIGPWSSDGEPCIDLGTDVRGRPVIGPSAPLGTAELRCSVPAGAAIFVSVFSSECSTLEAPPYDFGRNWLTGVWCALAVDRDITSVSLLVDHQATPVQQVVTGGIRFTNPDDDLFKSDDVGPARSTAHGWVALLDALPVGKHTLELHTAGTYLGELVDFSNTTIITVT